MTEIQNKQMATEVAEKREIYLIASSCGAVPHQLDFKVRIIGAGSSLRSGFVRQADVVSLL